ncbi:putative membrane protein [Xanthomonas arboricola]|nr:putative membrane protein [Xanthomonas campestris]MCW2007644.1 putative membrane protein [Xanthomonas campestris]
MVGLAVLALPVGLVIALVWVGRLQRRVWELEQRVAQWQGVAAPAAAARAGAPAQAAPNAPVDDQQPVPSQVSMPTEAVAPVPRATAPVPPPSHSMDPSLAARSSASVSEAVARTPSPVAASAQPTQPPSAPTPPPAPNAIERAASALKRWFTEGNVPVKVGMLVLLAGVASLLKYASDQGWMRMPVELRLAGISVVALAGLVFGWRQRTVRPGFALALQGGAIGGLLLTVFAAFKLYGLLGAGLAMGISVVLIAGMCVLAVLQDSRTLAVLGVLAGFLAPIWLSSGSGNHVALFSYYAVLNAGIVAVAWVRPWRVLNLLGFAFTFGIGTLWGALQYAPAKFATTEPFLLLFFAMYVAIPVLHARRGDGSAGKLIDGSLLFGTPLVAFALQARLLEGDRLPLALCALAVAALYAALAAWLLRRPATRLLGEAHAMLAVGFATLAVPLALSARATASVFALEGVGLLWLGLRQQRRFSQVSGVGLQVLAAIGVAFGVDAWRYDSVAVANATCMSTLLLALAGWASAWFLRDAGHPRRALVAYLWGLGWWTLCGVHEILRFAGDLRSEPDLLLGFVALTVWLAAEVHRRRPEPALVWTVMAGLALAAPLALWQSHAHTQPFAHWGALAWLAFAVAGARALWCLRMQHGAGAIAAQFIWWLLWPLVVSLGAAWLADAFLLANGWRCALLAAPWLIVAALGLLRWSWIAWPQRASFAPARTALLSCVFGVLGVGWVLVLLDPVSASPLPWLPLLNPAELAQLAVLALLARCAWSEQSPVLLQRWRVTALGVLGWALLTGSTLHSVHHWGAVPWDTQLLGATLSQTSLTIVWSVLGVLGWVIGSRRGQRGLWLGGALLMGLVLAKLVLVDRQHLGNLLGIGSFMAYGLLCTVVGYLAPAPPRQAPLAEESV